MVVIAVIVVVLAIALPALNKARGSALVTKSSANARSLGKTIQMFADSSGERYPRADAGVFYPGANRDVLFSFPYWQVFTGWTGIIYDSLPYAENIGVFLSPGSARLRDSSQNWPTSYQYSTSFVGDPKIWAGVSAPTVAMERSTKLSEVLFPAAKALLWDNEAAFLGGTPGRDDDGNLNAPTPITLADLAVRNTSPASATDAVPNMLGGPVSSRKLHNTRDGVRGRDF